MSKVICDVCGTTYPETAGKCPICGSAKPEHAAVLGSDTDTAGGYTYVKGGRFSKSNVKKRLQAHDAGLEEDLPRTAKKAPRKEKREPAPSMPLREEDVDDLEDDLFEDFREDAQGNEPNVPGESKSSGTKGLTIAIILLLIAIAAALAYIYFGFFAPQKPATNETTTAPTATQTAAATTTEETQPATTQDTTPAVIACEGLDLADKVITLDSEGDAWLLNVVPVPANTTDKITYTSADPSVATVNEEGKITALADGKTVITVTCGEVSVECTVNCDLAVPETTQPEETKPTETTKPAEAEFALNRKDITFEAAGDGWLLYKGDIPVSSIEWSTDDPDVATIRNGRVVAVGEGMTEVHGKYNGKKATCIIRVRFKQATDSTTEATSPEGSKGPYTLSDSDGDCTISVGETFSLNVLDSEGKPVSVSWTASVGGVCSVSGSKVTGVAKGKTTLTCSYGGQNFSCIIRVSG